MTGWKTLDQLPPSNEITPADPEATTEAQGVTVQPCDAAFVRTGRMTVWPDPAKYASHEPGVAQAGAAWRVDHGAMTVNADTLAFERLPIAGKAAHGYLFTEKGVTSMENVWLEDLAYDRVSELASIAAPVKLRGATGAPFRRLALPMAR